MATDGTGATWDITMVCVPELRATRPWWVPGEAWDTTMVAPGAACNITTVAAGAAWDNTMVGPGAIFDMTMCGAGAAWDMATDGTEATWDITVNGIGAALTLLWYVRARPGTLSW